MPGEYADLVARAQPFPVQQVAPAVHPLVEGPPAQRGVAVVERDRVRRGGHHRVQQLRHRGSSSPGAVPPGPSVTPAT
ncbi:hypothetical protein V2I01_42030 [Micromonospora sp. BRA006-A]|nr:hypothetical protein [Micromonospora sp. BRA006-A]